MSGRQEHRVRVPFEKFAVGTIRCQLWDRNVIAGPGIELVAITELAAKTRADQKT